MHALDKELAHSNYHTWVEVKYYAPANTFSAVLFTAQRDREREVYRAEANSAVTAIGKLMAMATSATTKGG